MTLPPDFQFSQTNLQDYRECARRFELRYIQQLKWPAVEAEPIIDRERHMKQGADFHHLVHQHLLGIPAEKLSLMAQTDPLRRWWNNYLRSGGVGDLPPQHYPELALSASVSGHRLLAKYDLIAVEPGHKAVIVDWKTAEKRPKRETLARRMQTVVYRYLLVQAGAYLNGGVAFQPEQIEMVYWFADDPANPERFPYDASLYKEDTTLLSSLIQEIATRTVFDLTADVRRCHFCTYRSLCKRGVEAGNEGTMDEIDDSDNLAAFDFDVNFDQIAEVEF